MRAPILPLVILALPLLLDACSATVPSGAATAPGNLAGGRCASPVAVSAGDTVYSVARRCGVSVRELIEANRLQPPYTLAAGMRLRMPGGGGQYVVQKGDTLLVVARRLHVDFQGLAAANGKAAPYTLRVGEALRIPGAFGDGGASQVVNSPRASGGYEAPPVRTAAVVPVPRDSAPPTPRTAPPAADAPVVPSPSAPPSPSPSAPPVPMPAPAGTSGHGFLWPVKGEVVAEFGPLAAKGQNNDGINIAAAKGAPVHAAENGVVAYVGNELKGFGNLVLVKHADGWMTAYAHNDQVAVRRGEAVRRGQTIATVGATGSVTTPQLHFEIRRGTEAVNPAEYLKDGPV